MPEVILQGAEYPSWLPGPLRMSFWDSDHKPEDYDDISIWGEYGEGANSWPTWMLIGAGLSMLSSVTQETARLKSASSGLVPLAMSGLSIGLYIALEFFPGQACLQVELTTTLIFRPQSVRPLLIFKKVGTLYL